MIILSSFWDISNLVSGNLVITNWSTDNLVNTDCFETFFGTVWKVFLRAFGSHLDYQNQSSIPRVIVQMKFVIVVFLILFMNSLTVSRLEEHCHSLNPIWGVLLVFSRNGDYWVEE